MVAATKRVTTLDQGIRLVAALLHTPLDAMAHLAMLITYALSTTVAVSSHVSSLAPGFAIAPVYLDII